MTNTLENKAKFFAQYWGQAVMVYNGKYITPSDFIRTPAISDCYLELTPLSQISDEDLIKCYHLHSEFIAYDYTMDFKPVLEMANHWRTNGGIRDIIRCTDTVDYLRSRGYALPWTRISVETLVEWEWVQLKGG